MNKDLFKKITVSVFLCSIFTTPALMILTEDKDINIIENKILQKLPRFNYENIKSGRFMDDFDTYVSDQFPGRNMFLYAKNGLNYALGQREFRDIYVTNSGRLLEKYTENKEMINYNIDKINTICENIDIKKTLFLVPNSISLYKNELPSFYLTDSQEDSINIIKKSSNIGVYTPLNVLKKHKDEYIYYNTDHHWTQLGAKIAFEDFYGRKLDYKYSKASDGFYGSYYSKAMLKDINPDDIYSYLELKDFYCEFDGEKSNSLYDIKKLDGKNKYQYFLNGDPAEGVIYGDGNGEVLVIKDSFAHNFIPFLTQIYEKIHVLDPRYSKKDISDYINENKNIDEVLFLLSLSTINSNKIFK